MKKVLTVPNEKIIDELLSRGVDNIYPDRETLKKRLMSGEKLRIYAGFDPTAPTLHIGHGIIIRKLSQFLKLGHEVIFLYGGFTATIGDPTDKTQARRVLSSAEVKSNMKNWKKQIGNIIDAKKITFKNNADWLSMDSWKKQIGKLIDVNKITFKNNSNWLSKLTFSDLAHIASYFTAQQTLSRDMFKKRMAAGNDLYLSEFLYPLMQAYDSVAMDVDLEIGGSDQMFNMLAGRTLMKKMKNKEKLVLTTKLLADPTGIKMGKSEGNMVALNDSPEDMFGKVMSWTDAMIVPALEVVTDVPLEMVRDVEDKLKNGSLNPRDAKLDLAYEVVKIYLGDKAAEAGRNNFKRVVQDKEKPKEIPEIKLEQDEIGVLDLFVKAGLAVSNGEVRRLIAEKGLKINDNLVNSVDLKVKISNEGLLLQRGKRQFAKVVRNKK